MAEYYERQRELGGKIRTAMIYPLILFAATVFVSIFLVAEVLPQFVSLLEGQPLPLFTRILLEAGAYMGSHGAQPLLFVPVPAVLLMGIFHIPSVRLALDRAIIHIPVIGKIVKTIDTARFSQTFGILYGNGAGILEALDLTGQVMGNSYIRKSLKDVAEELKRGRLLSGSLEEADIFLPVFVSMVAAGEESGRLDQVLGEAGIYYYTYIYCKSDGGAPGTGNDSHYGHCGGRNDFGGYDTCISDVFLHALRRRKGKYMRHYFCLDEERVIYLGVKEHLCGIGGERKRTVVWTERPFDGKLERPIHDLIREWGLKGKRVDLVLEAGVKRAVFSLPPGNARQMRRMAEYMLRARKEETEDLAAAVELFRGKNGMPMGTVYYTQRKFWEKLKETLEREGVHPGRALVRMSALSFLAGSLGREQALVCIEIRETRVKLYGIWKGCCVCFKRIFPAAKDICPSWRRENIVGGDCCAGRDACV